MQSLGYFHKYEYKVMYNIFNQMHDYNHSFFSKTDPSTDHKSESKEILSLLLWTVISNG
jgi:hypothetical protein